MKRLMLVTACLATTLAVAVSTASATPASNGTKLAEQVAKVYKGVLSAIGNTKSCTGVAHALQSYSKHHTGDFASISRRAKGLSKADKLVFARAFAARIAPLNAQLLSHLAPCLTNAEVQAALQNLNKVGR
jgi:hypothetical protein